MKGESIILKLYFGSLPSLISTALIVGFAVFFGFALAGRGSIAHWGLLLLIMLVLGFAMSIVSGIKDGAGSASAVVPAKHWTMTVLSVLGVLALLTGAVSLFIRKQSFWRTGFFILASIVIAKTLLTEILRVVHYAKHLP